MEAEKTGIDNEKSGPESIIEEKTEMQAQIMQYYGLQHQIMKLKEELIELANECKWSSATNTFLCSFLCEFADVKNMMEQIESKMTKAQLDLVLSQQVVKCERQISRIEELKNKETNGNPNL